MVGSQWDVGGAGFADGFAVVQRFLQGEQFQVFVNHIGDFVEYGGTFSCGGLAPCFERFLRGGDSGIDIGVSRVGKFRQCFAIGGIVRIQKRAGLRPRAVNQKAILFIEHIQIFCHGAVPLVAFLGFWTFLQTSHKDRIVFFLFRFKH